MLSVPPVSNSPESVLYSCAAIGLLAAVLHVLTVGLSQPTEQPEHNNDGTPDAAKTASSVPTGSDDCEAPAHAEIPSEKSRLLPQMEEVENPSTNKWLIVALAAGCGFSADLFFFGVASFFPVYCEHIGISSTVVGIITATQPCATLMFAWIGPKVLECFSPIQAFRVALFGLGICTLSFAPLQMIATSDNATLFAVIAFLLRFAQGIFQAQNEVACNTLVMRAFSADDVAMGVSITLLGRMLGVMTGPAFAGCIASSLGFAAPFTVGGALFIVCMTVGTMSLHNDTNAKEVGAQNASFKSILLIPAIVAEIATLSFVMIGYDAITPIFAHHVGDSPFNLSTSDIGGVFSLIASLAIVGNIVGTAVVTVYGVLGRCQLLSAIFVVTGLLLIGPAPFLGISQDSALTSLFIGCALVGLGIGLVVPPAQPTLLKIGLKHGLDMKALTAPVAALFSMAFNGGCFIGLIMGGALQNAVGFSYTAVCGAGIISFISLLTSPFLWAY